MADRRFPGIRPDVKTALSSVVVPAESARLPGLDLIPGFPNHPSLNPAFACQKPQAGIRAQDVVLNVETVEIRNENHLINLISGLPIGQRIRIQIWRNRASSTVEAIIGDWSKASSKLKAD